MKFYTWTATQKGAVCPYTGGLKLLLVSNFGSTVFKSAICAASSHKSMKSCSAATIFFLSTLNLSGETLCQKLHFMYYRRPLREYSCVINFHFKAKSSWNDVSEWVWSGANSNGNKKNEINNNAQRETASHSGTQQKYVFLKTWMRVYSSRLSLHTHTHTFRSRFWFLALLPHLTIVWKQVSNCMRWATHYSIFSSLLYHLRSVATCQPPFPSTSTVPLNPVGSNWPGVLHDREWCWELDGAC